MATGAARRDWNTRQHVSCSAWVLLRGGTALGGEQGSAACGRTELPVRLLGRLAAIPLPFPVARRITGTAHRGRWTALTETDGLLLLLLAAAVPIWFQTTFALARARRYLLLPRGKPWPDPLPCMSRPGASLTSNIIVNRREAQSTSVPFNEEPEHWCVCTACTVCGWLVGWLVGWLQRGPCGPLGQPPCASRAWARLATLD